MREQHLSDEAIAAYADGVLSGHARERARRHTESCLECHHAVAVQREAVWALRSAPAPALPAGLLDRLREVPATTPVRDVPAAVDERGTALFASFAAPAAALVAPGPREPRSEPRSKGRRSGPAALTAASIAVAGVLTGASGVAAPAHAAGSVRARPAGVQAPPPLRAGHTPAEVQVAQVVRAVAPGHGW